MSETAPNRDPKIVSRIQKLLGLTRSGNLHEAQSASKQAHKLMAEHGLTMADVMETKGGVYELKLKGHKFLEVWRWGLLTACSWANEAHTVRIEEALGDGNRIIVAHILGTKETTGAAYRMFVHFESAMDQASRKAVKEGEVIGSVELDSWRRGAVVAIQQRILTKDAETGPAISLRARALTITKNAQEKIKEHVKKEFKGSTYRPTMWKTSTDYTAYEIGQEFGRTVSLPDEEQKQLDEKAEAQEKTSVSGL